MTFAEFIAAHGLTMTAKPAGSVRKGDPEYDGWEYDAWRCTLRHGGRSMCVTFKTGTGWAGKPPSCANVLESLALDANDFCAPTPPTFKEWASNAGYDTDSRKAEKIFRACKRQSERLKALLGVELLTELVACEE